METIDNENSAGSSRRDRKAEKVVSYFLLADELIYTIHNMYYTVLVNTLVAPLHFAFSSTLYSYPVHQLKEKGLCTTQYYSRLLDCTLYPITESVHGQAIFKKPDKLMCPPYPWSPHI